MLPRCCLLLAVNARECIGRLFAAYSGKMAHFPGGRAQLMKVPKLGYSLETVVFAVFGAASLALVLMPFLGGRPITDR